MRCLESHSGRSEDVVMPFANALRRDTVLHGLDAHIFFSTLFIARLS